MSRLAASIVAVLVVAAIAPAAATAAPAPAPVPASTAADAGTAAVLEGIDVSHWQGTITWSKVAAAGKKFAIIKASEDDDFVDDHYLTNRAGAQAAGHVDGLLSLRPAARAAANDAVNEADHFVEHGPVRRRRPDPGARPRGCRRARRQRPPGLGQGLARPGDGADRDPADDLREPGVLEEVPRRLACDRRCRLQDALDRALGRDQPAVPGSNWGGNGWKFWQYSNAGSVSGISGRVDLDRFNGTDLAAPGVLGLQDQREGRQPGQAGPDGRRRDRRDRPDELPRRDHARRRRPAGGRHRHVRRQPDDLDGGHAPRHDRRRDHRRPGPTR